MLAGEHPSLRELAAATGRRPEPWRVAVLLGAGRADELSRHERGQLDRLLRTGAACGVHLVDAGSRRCGPPPGIEVIDAAPGDAARLSGAGDLPVGSTRARRPAVVTATCRRIADEVAAGPAAGRAGQPAARAASGSESSAHGADRAARRQPAGRRGAGDPERLSAARPDRRARPAPARPT